MPRSPLRPRSRLTHFVSGVFAFVMLAVLVGGLPLALVRFGGNPMPHQIPAWTAVREALLRRDITGSLFIRVLDVVGWAAWASFALSVLVEIAARLRGRRTIRLPGLALQQRWAAGLLTSIALIVSSPAVASASPLTAHSARPAAVTVLAHAPTPGSTSLVYEVRRGDYLGAVAERFGGEFSDATQLAHDNHVADANHIEAGWRITLPLGAKDSGTHDHATGTLVERPDVLAVPSPSPGTHTLTGPVVGPTDGTGTASHVGNDSSGHRSPGQRSPGQRSSGQRGTGTSTHPASTASSGALLVEMLEASGTLAAVVSLALIGIRRREQLQRRLAGPASSSGSTRSSGTTNGAPPRLMAATRAEDIVRLDAALRVLAERVEDWPAEYIPQIVGVWLDQGTATLLLAEDCGVAPEPFVYDSNGWALPASSPLPYAANQLAPLPSLCTVGGRSDQHILLDLEYLRVLSIGGDPDEAMNLLRFIAVELCHNVWSDDVRVTLAGFGALESRLVAVGPDRIRTQPSIHAAIDRFSRRLARAASAWDQSWTPEVLLIANPTDDDRDTLAGLEREMMEAPGAGMSVVVGPISSPIGRYHMDVTPTGDLHIGFLGDAIVPAAALPDSLLPEVARLLAAARASGSTGPLDLARAASRAVLAQSDKRPAKLAGQHRHDGSPQRRRFRSELVDLTKPRHVRPTQFGWNS